MTKRLTVSELSNILGVSVNTTWKKIKKKGLTTLKESVNNRVITVIEVTQDELDTLMDEQNVNNPANKGVMNQNYEENDTIYTPYEAQPQNLNNSEAYSLMQMVMNYSKEMNDISQAHMDRIIEAETKVRLLEDSENKSMSHFHEISAENKQLKERNKELETKVQELEQRLEKLDKKWWNKRII